MTIRHARTVSAVLERLDTNFAEFADAFNDGQYILWLGSGISRARVPNVYELLERVLEHLRSRIVDRDPDCEYRAALYEVIRFAGLTDDEFATIDFSITVEHWSLRDRVLSVLVNNYAAVLDVPVGDCNPGDYLVWSALDVPTTYGSPDLEPDVEHYCVAILMLEGLVESAVTANWDGLIEKALDDLTPAFETQVRVAVKPDDFRISGPRIEVVKFHGCAVRARDHQAEYRKLLIARESQISAWTVQPQNESMKKRLESLYTNRLTLMVGLSAQDANLHTVFAQAIQALARPWPASPPAVVLSEETLAPYHRNLLKLTYGPNYEGNASAIEQSALLGAYAKPTLLALVLSSLTEKLGLLVERRSQIVWADPATLIQLRAGLVSLRDSAARQAVPKNHDNLDSSAIADHQREFLRRLIDVANMALAIFRTGRSPTAGDCRYMPLSDRPIGQAVHSADFPSEQFSRFGLALALIGRGVSSGHWSAVPGASKAPDGGVVRLASAQRDVRVFFVKDAPASAKLESGDLFDETEGDVLVVVADEELPAFTRSPKSRYGRDGKISTGRFNVSTSVAHTTSADDLYEAFKLAGGF